MKFSEIYITELRQGVLRLAKQTFPSWPDYVVTDWIYKGLNEPPNNQNNQKAVDWITATKQRYGQLQFQLETLEITLDIFDPESQQRIKERQGGASNPQNIPNDAARHAQQQQMLAKDGISKEPIIVAQTPQGYELLEGMHRTIQNLKMFPEGYVGPAWVGKGPLGRVSAELGGD
jgi:hypothetical protein|tara:strand:+ start:92 stop:616 length:525 start_codon:yes stop_codon:yes gene_type:complete